LHAHRKGKLRCYKGNEKKEDEPNGDSGLQKIVASDRAEPGYRRAWDRLEVILNS